MSTRNVSWGVKAAGTYGWQPYHLHVPIVLKSGSLNLLEPSGPVQACNGTALPFITFILFVVSYCLWYQGVIYYLAVNVLRFCCQMSDRVIPRPSGTDGGSYVCSTSSVPKLCFANGFENVRSSGVDSLGYVPPVMNWWSHKMRAVCW
jgi:hypothetical protein